MQILVLDSQAKYYADELSKVAPNVEVHIAASEDEVTADALNAEVLVGLAPYLKPSLLEAMPNLKWIQALTTGVDNLMSLHDIAITNCHGIHGPQMSEMAVMLMLSSARQFDKVIDNQRQRKWERAPQPLLANKTVCIVGVGAISEHLAQLLGAFGMRVIGISSRETAAGFDQLYSRETMNSALAEADFVVLLTPYTAQNHHIIDAKALSAMRPTAHLVNLSRGGCVDEDALIAALDSGSIAGAASDVFATEPLPPESPLWAQSNFIVTPHLGGFSDVYHEQAFPTVAQNISDYLEGGVTALRGRLDQ